MKGLFKIELFSNDTEFQEKIDRMLTNSSKHCPNLKDMTTYNNNAYLPPHWPTFNGKYPEDMTSVEIMEYIERDDFESIYKIISYSRGYCEANIIILYNQLLQKTDKKEHITSIIRIVDILFEMFPQYSEEYMLNAKKNNSIEIINHINTTYKYYI